MTEHRTTSAADHGTRARYEQACRCADCKTANRVYQRGYRMRYRGDMLESFVARHLPRELGDG